MMLSGIRHFSLPPPNACNTQPGDGNPVPGFFFPEGSVNQKKALHAQGLPILVGSAYGYFTSLVPDTSMRT